MKKINPMKKILKQTQVSIIALLAVVALSSCVNKQGGKTYEDAIDIPVYQEMQAELTPPPHVPTPVGKRKAKKLIVDMEIVELEGTMTDGVTIYIGLSTVRSLEVLLGLAWAMKLNFILKTIPTTNCRTTSTFTRSMDRVVVPLLL